MIRNVVFDIGKVLMSFDWDDFAGSLFDEETAAKVTAAMFGGPWWKELDRAVMTEEEILEHFCSECPEVTEQIHEAFNRVGECAARRDWVIPMLESIRKKGYKIFFLSNMSEHVKQSNPPVFDFVEHMDGGVWSCDVKLIKPDPAIYKTLLDKYDLKAEECLFIDDLEENLAAARRLGLKGLRFDSREQLAADLDKAFTKDATHDKVTILCYGDSNTYGYDPSTGGRYPYDKRWTTLLEEMLGSRYEVISEGLNGRTTAYDRPGAEWKNGASSITACLGTHKPVDIITIMLGTNDCDADMGLSAEQIAGGMEALVRLVKEKSPELQGYTPRIIVIAPANIGKNYQDSPFASKLTPESVRKSYDIGPLYAKIAADQNCDFINAIDCIEVSELDSEHLSEAGHRQLAELVYNEIVGKK